MPPEEKFAIGKPKQSLLDELRELVDQIEGLAHQKAPYADKLNHLSARLPVPTTIEEICSYYGTILETNTSPARGRIIDLIVFKNFKDPHQLLAEPKKGRGRVIRL